MREGGLVSRKTHLEIVFAWEVCIVMAPCLAIHARGNLALRWWRDVVCVGLRRSLAILHRGEGDDGGRLDCRHIKAGCGRSVEG